MWFRCGVGSSSIVVIGRAFSITRSSSLRAPSLREKKRCCASTCLWFHSAGCSTDASQRSGEPSAAVSAPASSLPRRSSFCLTSRRSRLKTFDFHFCGAYASKSRSVKPGNMSGPSRSVDYEGARPPSSTSRHDDRVNDARAQLGDDRGHVVPGAHGRRAGEVELAARDEGRELGEKI